MTPQHRSRVSSPPPPASPLGGHRHRIAALAAAALSATVLTTPPPRRPPVPRRQLLALPGTAHRPRPCTSRRDAGPAWGTHDMQITVGPLREVTRGTASGVRVRHWIPRGAPKATLRALDLTRRQLAWLTARLGPYPFAEYGVLATPFGGEMETQTLTTLSVDELQDPVSVDAVMLHELAHQWSGNSVSVRRWGSDLWLAEGHATYYENSYPAPGDRPARQGRLPATARLDRPVRPRRPDRSTTAPRPERPPSRTTSSPTRAAPSFCTPCARRSEPRPSSASNGPGSQPSAAAAPGPTTSSPWPVASAAGT